MNQDRRLGSASPALGAILFVVSLVVALVFQNCSKVDFGTTDELLKAGIDGELRSVRLNPQTEESRPKINLTAIVDNSESMQPIQNQVASALSKVTPKLKGFSGSVEIYTTTQTNEAKSSVKTEEYLQYTDASGVVTLALGRESEIPAPVKYSIVEEFKISEPWTLNRAPLAYRADMNASEFDNFSQAAGAAIANIGIGGSDSERGLCSLMRAIESKSDPEAYEAFVLVANEDDATTLANCRASNVSDINKVEDPIPQDVACQDSDPNCKFAYTVDYQRKKKETLQIKGRKTKHYIEYWVDDLRRNDRLRDIKYKRHKFKKDYELKRYTRSYEYERYVLVDNLEKPEGLTREIIGIDKEVGSCSEELDKQAIDCAEVEELLPNGSANLGLVAGSCSVTCSNETPSSGEVDFGSWHGGACASNAAIPCSQSEREDLASYLGVSVSHVNSCEVACDDQEQGVGDIKLSSMPGNCGDPCSSSQQAEVISRLQSSGINYVSAGDITSCNVRCGSYYPKGTLSYYDENPDQCPGQGEGSTGKDSWGGSSELTSGMWQAVFNKSGLDSEADFHNARVRCEQSIETVNKTIDNNSMCSTNADCVAAQLTDMEAELLSKKGLSANRVVAGSCRSLCQNGSSKASCRAELPEAGLCVSGNPFGTLSTLCSGGDFEVSSCEQSAGSKVDYIMSYSEDPQAPVSNSLFPGTSSIETQVADRLNDKFAGNYFLASFVVPPGDPKCEPENDRIDPAFRYKALHDQLPGDNGELYPICLDDYSDALSFSLDLIVKTARRSYILELNPENEFIWKINVLYSDGNRVLLDPAMYSLNQQILSFDERIDIESITEMDIQIVTENQ